MGLEYEHVGSAEEYVDSGYEHVGSAGEYVDSGYEHVGSTRRVGRA